MLSVNMRLGVRNLVRHKRRTLLTAGAVGFAAMLLVFVVSFQLGTYAGLINFTVRILTGHIQVQAPGYNKQHNIRKVVDQPRKIRKQVLGVKGVENVAFRCRAFSLVSSKDRTYGAMVVGVEPEREALVSTLAKTIRSGKYLEKGDKNAAVIGQIMARNLQVGVGDELVLMGQGRDGSIAAATVNVKGIYSSGQDDYDRSVLQIDMESFQETYFMNGAVHEVVVLCSGLGVVKKDKKAITALVKGDGQKLAVLDWMELSPGLVDSIKMDMSSGGIFYVLLVIIVAFSILNTFIMSVLERTKEFGVMMALGQRPVKIFKMVITESFLLAFGGVVAGALLGALVTLYFQEHGIVMPDSSAIMKQYGLPESLYPQLGLFSLTAGPLLVFVLTMLSAFFPALKVLKLKPVEALRHNT